MSMYALCNKTLSLYVHPAHGNIVCNGSQYFYRISRRRICTEKIMFKKCFLYHIFGKTREVVHGLGSEGYYQVDVFRLVLKKRYISQMFPGGEASFSLRWLLLTRTSYDGSRPYRPTLLSLFRTGGGCHRLDYGDGY